MAAQDPSTCCLAASAEQVAGTIALPCPAASAAQVADPIALPCACQGPDQINIKDITTPPFDLTGGYQLEYTHGENPKNLPTVNLTRSGGEPQ